ncbi:chemotaxis protein [Hydrogenophaga crassostreae]|uniref:Chemotaxis protein n=1 Tax=Hydrogenophaga crassostreae TaxID=1763535 RepID=A0A167GGM7_9BURK|nr:methyl-accepting chemotaxis protein [Hydrogenophaga crassostreae]AOW15939.1 methyl-accepting chemotaxis protein [Hydrogenophaga crassostreae]OAD39427.1 chemotaxis protein [Hydrogenophaga crassostreae]
MILQNLMRRFSIRQRMLSAIGVVVLLLAIVGAVGGWGMHRQAQLSESLVNESFQDSLALSGLRLALADMSRFEKDMVIQYESPEQLSLANMYWERSRDQVGQTLKDLLTSRDSEQQALLASMQAHLADYVKEVEPVVANIRAGTYRSATVASRVLDKADQRYAELLRDARRFQTLLEDQAGALRAESEATGKLAMMAFGVAVLVAVLVVVPTTLANMQSICQPLDQAQAVANAITSGDLTQPIHNQGRDELTALTRALSDMQGSLVRIVGEVRGTTAGIGAASAEIASGNLDLSTRTENAAGNLQQAAGSLEQINSMVRQSAEAARQASAMAVANADVAARGGHVMGQVVSTMDQINHSSKQISDIIGVIDSIAFQTNILALNAAVEAARAGEQGRGFAVVASEVRNLAQRSATAAKEIKVLIGSSVDTVAKGSRLVGEAGATIGEIVANAQKVSAFISDITTAANEQSQGIGQVNDTVSELDQMTQQNAALVEQSAAAAESLREQAARLTQVVQIFRMGSPGDPRDGHFSGAA